MSEMDDCYDCPQHFEDRAVDNSAWSGGAAMASCTSADSPASCFGAICAGKKAGPTDQRGSWALPHHKSPGSPPNAAAVRNALARLPQTQGLTNRAEAERHLQNHMASIQAQSASRPPRDDLVRAAPGGYELRWAEEEHAGMPTLIGHFARFNEWTLIDSMFEGRFMERIAPGAFSKTIAENLPNMRVLFQHGKDPSIGDKVLGPIEELREDDQGAYYEVPLLDTSYNRDLLPGLEQGLYGASFRFRVTREDVDQEPKASKHNPEGIPERTIREAAVMEFGPVTFPAYAGATAGVRSLTDEFVLGKFLEAPDRTLAMAQNITHTGGEGDAAAVYPTPVSTTTSDGTITVVRAGAEPHPDSTGTSPEPPPTRAEEPTKEVSMENGTPSVEELEQRNREITARLQALDAQYGTRQLEGDDKSEWDNLMAEREGNEARITEAKARRAYIERIAQEQPQRLVDPTPKYGFEAFKETTLPKGDGLYDLSTVRSRDMDPEGARREYRDRAHQAVDEHSNYPAERPKDEYQERVHHLIDSVDSADSFIARRVLLTGHPKYESAFWKKLANRGLSAEEDQVLERALTVATEGQYAVPFTLDPTLILSSQGVANPLRRISRVETIATHTWKGVSSTSMTLGYSAEAAEVGDDSPTLTQPEVAPLRVDAFVPFSVELDQDWAQLRTEMTRLIADGKDILETTKFTLGTGAPEPEGVLVGAGTWTVTTAGTAALAVGDLYNLEADLGPRFRGSQSAAFIGSKTMYNKVRQLDTTGGSALWARLAAGQPSELLGYPAYEDSAMSTVLTTGGTILCFGDFSRFLIVDRVGMDVELVPHLFGTAGVPHRPTGQRGLLAIWRNSSVVLTAGAFRKLKTL